MVSATLTVYIHRDVLRNKALGVMIEKLETQGRIWIKGNCPMSITSRDIKVLGKIETRTMEFGYSSKMTFDEWGK